jgi:hypothetical protein
MRRYVSAIRGVCGLAFAALAFGACSDNGGGGPAPGVATVSFAPQALTVPYVNLTRARVQLDRLQVVGNTFPPPSSSQPPPDHPPPDDQPPQFTGVSLDALSPTTSTTIDSLPQGLYSRVRFLVGRVSIDGTWRGTPFHVSLAPFGATVDIRAPAPQELGLDQDAAFQVSVALDLWFPPYLFDNAALDDRGQIICDDVSNPQMSGPITQWIAASFALR